MVDSKMMSCRRLAGLTFVVAAMFFGCTDPFAGPVVSRPPKVTDLIKELGYDFRPFELRLADFGYAPCQPKEPVGNMIPSFGCSERPSFASARGKAFARLSARALVEAKERPSARSLHVAGVVLLISRRVDEAIEALRQAADLSGNDARVLNDLAAAQGLRAWLSDQPSELVRALESLEKALGANASLHEARFNQAVILEALFLRSEASNAWLRFLEQTDAGLPWADDARYRRRILRDAEHFLNEESVRMRLEDAINKRSQIALDDLIARFSQVTRLYGEEELLPAWAEAHLGGDEVEAARILEVARAIGLALRESNGERMLIDSVVAIDQALVHQPARRTAVEKLAEGHRAFREALPLVRMVNIKQARRYLDVATEGLAGRSPFAAWVEFYQLVCDFYELPYSKSSERIGDFRDRVDASLYPNLVGRALWLEGLTHTRRRSFGQALTLDLQALSLFQSTRESQNVAYLHYLIAENLQGLGASEKAWIHRYFALRNLDLVHDLRRAHNILFEIGSASLLQGDSAAALHFQNVMVQLAEQNDNPVTHLEALRLRARTLSRRGELELSLADLTAASSLAQGVSEEIRHRAVADLALARGQILQEGRPAQAAISFTDALAYYERSGYRYYLPALHLARARSYLREGRSREAELDLHEGISEFETDRVKISEAELRISFFRDSRALFDEMVQLQARQGNVELGLQYAEHARSRVLLDLLADFEPQIPSSIKEIQAGLPRDTALVIYSVLPRDLLIWVVTLVGVKFQRETLAEVSIVDLLRQLDVLFAAGNAMELDPLLTQLHELLFQPVATYLEGIDSVAFVPDKMLHRVPFAALRDTRSGRYLIEEKSVVVAPSATIFVKASERRRNLGLRVPDRILAIGDPDFDRSVFLALPRLPGAADEAAMVASLYPESHLLLGEAATGEGVRSSLSSYQVIHFAGHAIVDQESPFLSRLILAGADTLSAYDLYNYSFDQTRLVLLSACDTARGDEDLTEGVSALARPFLAAGVPGVIVSLWKVQDRTTAELMASFHRQLRCGKNEAAALRAAQMRFLESRDLDRRTPAAWAAFQFIGGTGSPAGILPDEGESGICQ